MKNIELLELEGKIKNPIMEFLLEHDNYLEKEQIDAILSRGESGLEDLRLILKSYNHHHVKFLEENTTFVSNVLMALNYLRDENSFDDMITYLYTNYKSIDYTWSDSYFESFPICYGIFPDRISQIKQVFYDPELTVDLKRILMMGLYSMPTLLQRPELKETIAPIFLDYLQFILNPENRKTQDRVHEEWVTLDELFDTTIEGYMHCGGDGNHPAVQQAVKEGLINEGFSAAFSKEDLQKWEQKVFELDDIYSMNAAYERVQKINEEFDRGLEAKKIALETEIKEKKEEINRILNVTKQFRKIYDRNEKVSVKYKADGKVISDVKYKKVEDDLISGKCELI
jgi:hypothetical protein